MTLSYNIIHKIYEFNSANEYNNLKVVNKHFRKHYDKKILERIIKIQKCFKKNRVSSTYGVDLPYFMPYNKYLRFVALLKRKMYYRKIMVWYNDHLIFPIPEQILRRLNSESSRHMVIRDWVQHNLPNVNERKRSDILLFLKENRITCRELLITGV